VSKVSDNFYGPFSEKYSKKNIKNITPIPNNDEVQTRNETFENL